GYSGTDQPQERSRILGDSAEQSIEALGDRSQDIEPRLRGHQEDTPSVLAIREDRQAGRPPMDLRKREPMGRTAVETLALVEIYSPRKITAWTVPAGEAGDVIGALQFQEWAHFIVPCAQCPAKLQAVVLFVEIPQLTQCRILSEGVQVSVAVRGRTSTEQ